MSKNDEPNQWKSKYLHMFNSPGTSRPPVASTSRSTVVGDQAKFRNPSEFFRPSQSSHSQAMGYGRSGEDEASATTCRVLQMQWSEKSQSDPSGKALALDLPKSTFSFKVDDPAERTWTTLPDSPRPEVKQTSDPWFTDDIWGDIPEKDLDECMNAVQTQIQGKTRKSPQVTFKKDILSLLCEDDPLKTRNEETPKAPSDASNKDDILTLLCDNDGAFLNALDDSFHSQTFVGKAERAASDAVRSEPKLPGGEVNLGKSSLQPNLLVKTKSESIICPEVTSGTLNESQKKLAKHTKSLPHPLTTSSHTTDWLRSQLEKMNVHCTQLSESIQLKEGETRLLREKLKLAEDQVEKYQRLKTAQNESVKQSYEKKVKDLQKQLDATQVQLMLKLKESESNLGKYKELKSSIKSSPKAGTSSFDYTKRLSGNDIPSPVFEDRFRFQKKPISDVSGTSKSELLALVKFHLPKRGTLRSGTSPAAALSSRLRSFDGREKRQSNRYVPGDGSKLSKAAQFIIKKIPEVNVLNHFVPPKTNYLSQSIFYNDISDSPLVNYNFRQPTLNDIWGVSYHVFGQTNLTEYEKKKIGDPIEIDPAVAVLSSKRYFTTLNSIRDEILILMKHEKWGLPEFEHIQKVIFTVTDMVREFYATMADPRNQEVADTVMEREEDVFDCTMGVSELSMDFDPLSPDPFQDETNVDLRRGLILVGEICTINRQAANYVLNPRSKNNFRFGDHPSNIRMEHFDDLAPSTRPNETVKPPTESCESDTANPTHPPISIEDVLSHFCVERKTEEVLQTQNSEDQIEKMKNLEALLKQREELLSKGCWTEEKAIELAKLSKHLSMRRSGTVCETECMDSENDREELVHVDEIERKTSAHELLASQKFKVDDILAVPIPQVIQNRSFMEAMLSPVDRCLNPAEKKLLMHTAANVERIKQRMAGKLEPIVESESAKESSSKVNKKRPADPTVDLRYRPIPSHVVQDENLVVAAMKDKLEHLSRSPQCDNLTETTKQETVDVVSVSAETNNEAIGSTSERMAPETKTFKVKGLSKKSTLAPPKARANIFKDTTEAPPIDMKVIEEDIANMYKAASPPTQEPVDPFKSEGPPDIEHIPDLVNAFHSKLKNAGLLELICELFKETGILRFSHKMGGPMIGALIMLQELVVHRPIESRKHLNKIVAVLREVVYTRPSPLVIYEVNVTIKCLITLEGFTKMLCHNAGPETFVVQGEITYFKRGACLMETLCLIMDFSHNDSTSFKSALQMVHWVYYILCEDNSVTHQWYKSQDSRRCFCLTALANTIVKILYRGVLHYRALVFLCSQDAEGKKSEKMQFQRVVLCGIGILSLLRKSYTKFLVVIQSDFKKYQTFIELTKTLHDDSLNDFTLNGRDLKNLNFLVTDLQSNPKVQKSQGQTNRIKIGPFEGNRHWPTDRFEKRKYLAEESSDEDS